MKSSRSLVIPVLLVSCCAALAAQPELRLAVPLLVGVTAAMVLLLTLALYRGERTGGLWSPAVILVVALLMRLLFLSGPPQLSDDSYRYLWDGSNLLHGINPYSAAPSALVPTPALQSVHARINHPDFVTIYPPAAQLLFAGGSALGGTITGLKSFLVLLDLGLCVLLVLLLQLLGRPPWLAVLYAWNPLPVLEIAGSGHIDGAGLTLLIGSCCLLMLERQRAAAIGPRRWPVLLSGALLACAGLVKLFPLALAPVLFLLVPAGRRRHFLVGFFGALAELMVPFLPQLTNIGASLDAYARNWEFAGFAFNTLRSLTGSGATARLMLWSSFVLLVISITTRLQARIKRGLTTQDTGCQILEACYLIALALLFLTPTLQPWYALLLAAFLPFGPGPAALVLCWVVFLTYQVQTPYFILGQWTENRQVTVAVFLAPVTAYLLGKLFKGRRVSAGGKGILGASGFVPPVK